MKQIVLNVIEFIEEKEKFEPVILLITVNERLSPMLAAISMRSVEKLKSEMKEIEHDMMKRTRKMDEEKQDSENQTL